MGYESRLYIVDKTDIKHDFNGEELRYAQILAIYDMSKFYGFGQVFQKETDCFVYADDGNTEILEDRYGDRLKEASIKEVIEFIEEVKNNNEPYRRINPLLEMLKGINEHEWNDIVVLHYGY